MDADSNSEAFNLLTNSGFIPLSMTPSDEAFYPNNQTLCWNILFPDCSNTPPSTVDYIFVQSNVACVTPVNNKCASFTQFPSFQPFAYPYIVNIPVIQKITRRSQKSPHVGLRVTLPYKLKYLLLLLLMVTL